VGVGDKSEAAPRLQSRPLSCVKIKELVLIPLLALNGCNNQLPIAMDTISIFRAPSLQIA
jgi:hypothetical protein